MAQDCVITAAELITPLGGDASTTWQGLLAGASIQQHSYARVQLAGCQPRVVELAERLIERLPFIDRTERTALVVGTSKGPADDWLPQPLQTFDPPTSDNLSCEDVTSGRVLRFIRQCEDVTPEAALGVGAACEDITGARVLSTVGVCEDVAAIPCDPIKGLHAVAAALNRRLRLRGHISTLSAACASGLHALIRGAMLLHHGDADQAIVIASESSLHPAFIQSFRRLGVLASLGEPCRPMDQRRSGFLISEAAAMIVLQRRPAKPGEVVIERYAMGADASHLTSTAADAAALKHCLRQVLDGRAVDLVHAHATGTVANDPIELAAIEACLPDDRATIYSHKGAIGHSLGASGLVATVLNLLMHRHGVVPGNVNTRRPISTRAGRISSDIVQRPIQLSIVLAAGFGGATGAISIVTK